MLSLKKKKKDIVLRDKTANLIKQKKNLYLWATSKWQPFLGQCNSDQMSGPGYLWSFSAHSQSSALIWVIL